MKTQKCLRPSLISEFYHSSKKIYISSRISVNVYVIDETDENVNIQKIQSKIHFDVKETEIYRMEGENRIWHFRFIESK